MSCDCEISVCMLGSISVRCVWESISIAYMLGSISMCVRMGCECALESLTALSLGQFVSPSYSGDLHVTGYSDTQPLL